MDVQAEDEKAETAYFSCCADRQFLPMVRWREFPAPHTNPGESFTVKDQARRLTPRGLNWRGVDLRHWRENQFLTQAEAAQVLDLSLRAYTDRERGVSAISRECILACLYIRDAGWTRKELEKAGFIGAQ